MRGAAVTYIYRRLWEGGGREWVGADWGMGRVWCLLGRKYGLGRKGLNVDVVGLGSPQASEGLWVRSTRYRGNVGGFIVH